VDQSSAPDFVGVALNLAGLTSKSDEKNRTSYSVTASAYSLYAAAVKHDPLDPAFYTQHRDWRRFSVTLGQEFPDQAGAGSDQRSTLVGFKFLLWDKRDASDPSNRGHLQVIADGLKSTSRNFSEIDGLVRRYIYYTVRATLSLPESPTADDVVAFENRYFAEKDQFAALLRLLKDEDVRAINKIIEDRIDVEVQLADQTRKAIEAIRRAPQWSVTFQNNLGKDGAADRYRVESTFDYGLPPKVNLSLNGSFDYKTADMQQSRTRGGRFAAEGQFQLTPEARLSGKQPWLLNVSADGSWMTGSTPTYKTQLKLTIPIMSGINFPVSVTYANRTDLIKEADVKGRFGFTFDFAKLMQSFK
jgi:hypothetical protein